MLASGLDWACRNWNFVPDPHGAHYPPGMESADILEARAHFRSQIDTEETLEREIGEWLSKTPHGRALSYAKGLVAYCQKKESPLGMLRAALRADWSLEAAGARAPENVAQARSHAPSWVPPSEKAWVHVREEFGRPADKEEDTRRQILVQRYLKAQPQIQVNGAPYSAPHSADAEWEALSADREQNPDLYPRKKEPTQAVDLDLDWTDF